MTRLDRYLIRHVLALTAIVGLGLVSIYTVVVFVSDINETGKGHYGVLQALQYSVLMAPSSLYILMPIVALLGTLMGVGALARSSELTAMRASGVSLTRIGLATLAAGVLLGALGFTLGDWLAPAGERVANALRDDARGTRNSLDRSLWLRDAELIVRIRKLDAEDEARELSLYRLAPDGRVSEVIAAERAHYDGAQWQLSGVRRTQFDGTTPKVDAMSAMTLAGNISPNVLRLFILEADNLSVRGLTRLIAYLDDNHLDASKYRIWLWRKLVEPLTVIAMMLFAVPFVIGTLRDAGAGQRLLVGVLVGIVFYVANKVSVSVGDLYAWPAPIAAGLPTMVLLTIAGWRLRRAR